MSRRAPLPGAAELFRTTGAQRPAGREDGDGDSDGGMRARARAVADGDRRGTGRQKHDAKITVYVADEELLALEQVRLSLRAEHGLGVDRGRIVREAIAVLLADFDEHGDDSVLVRRLRQEPAR